MKSTMIERLISRVLNLLNNSDLGTYVTFLDEILERYNEGPHSQLGTSRMPLDVYRKAVVVPKNFRFMTRKILRKGQQVRVSLMKNLFQKRSTRQWSEEVFHDCKSLYDGSNHLHIGRNILFRGIKNSMNYQFTSNQNTTNDFAVKVKPPIDSRDSNTYISVNKIFCRTTL